MSEQMSKHDQVLLTLVMNLQGSVMVQLGKLADPATGKMARSLDGARYVIDVLEMLQTKCRAETHPEIVTMLDRVVMELQLNYTDEVKKGGDEPEPPVAEDAGDSAKSTPDEPAPEAQA
ncbi:DUF1844 domain-containing protein [bacterium]|nr:DUF1844 domain-containing protein [bacterium]MBU1677179.1 DUF1844 domain-containing protein [bacterium]